MMLFQFILLSHLQLTVRMKQQSSSVINGRSMFSVNTNLTTAQQGSNSLHNFYHPLFNDCDDYPLLCKLLFLQLILRQNMLIYSNRRAQIKDIWNKLAKKLGPHNSSIFIVDSNTKMEDLLPVTTDNRRMLLFDLSSLNNTALNYLLNHSLQDISILVVESPDKPLRAELSDIFPLVFFDDGEQNFDDILRGSEEKSKKMEYNFQNQKFNQSVALNFKETLECKEQQGFLKIYLSVLRDRIASKFLTVPHSRWKKMLRVLHFIGLTKLQGSFKRLSLVDCLFSPQCLGRSKQQLELISKANEEAFLQIIPYYGQQKLLKQLLNHYWIQQKRKQYFFSLIDKIKSSISFFYPCTKFPQTVKLQNQGSAIYYRITGHDKKLMSDKYLQISGDRQYRLTLKYRSQYSVVMHFGVACYDQNRNCISPVQVCRYEDTAVRVGEIGDKYLRIVEQDRIRLGKWKDPSCFAFQKCIGIYNQGHIDKCIGIDEVIYSEADSYSKDPSKGAYHNITFDKIQLNDIGIKKINQMKHLMTEGITMVANHYEGGTYAIGCSESGVQKQWKTVTVQYKGLQRKNTGRELLLGTKSVRIVIMSNYNSGYPDFKVEEKGGSVDLRCIEWVSI